MSPLYLYNQFFTLHMERISEYNYSWFNIYEGWFKSIVTDAIKLFKKKLDVKRDINFDLKVSKST